MRPTLTSCATRGKDFQISIPRARNFEIVCLSATVWGAEQADNFPANVWHSSSTRKWVSLMQRVTAGVGNKLVEACARESK